MRGQADNPREQQCPVILKNLSIFFATSATKKTVVYEMFFYFYFLTSGRMLTPMRKLIMKMEDMALLVCNQCVSDNGKKPENDDYSVSFDLNW